ncbi:MAG: S-adenosylmethionine:tRNA ribosyltransferase-isomerase [Chloroflexota bacterium]|nr:S-adenosylmethionine:tRNA ribosyltransferase-isomerase [Chloroflexota bacterium]
MKTDDFYYDLPPELIAQVPLQTRTDSRLLVYSRAQERITHTHFRDIRQYLRPGDLLVVNNTRVIPARLYAHKETGGKVEVLLLKKLENEQWEVLVGGKRVTSGKKLTFDDGVEGTILAELEGAKRIIQFNQPVGPHLKDLGEMPLPPYIHEPLKDPERYQTVYAEVEGSAAAPTAGLHFTKEIMAELRDYGVEFAEVLLHVGLDTFAPVTEDTVEEHKIHTEWCQVSAECAAQINRAKAEGRRVIAVGTTSVRTLESAADGQGGVRPYADTTGLFIYPGYAFQVVDAIITNFHLPKSTLLMLVSAFAGRENILRCYNEAIKEKYRFYSFGDAMLIE